MLERAVRTCRNDSDVADALDPADLQMELLTEYQQLGRWDDALAATDAAVDAGLDMHPDPREKLSRPVDRGVSGDLRSGVLIAV